MLHAGGVLADAMLAKQTLAGMRTVRDLMSELSQPVLCSICSQAAAVEPLDMRTFGNANQPFAAESVNGVMERLDSPSLS